MDTGNTQIPERVYVKQLAADIHYYLMGQKLLFERCAQRDILYRVPRRWQQIHVLSWCSLLFVWRRTIDFCDVSNAGRGLQEYHERMLYAPRLCYYAEHAEVAPESLWRSSTRYDGEEIP